MKKVFTVMLVACLLTLGLAGAAMAGNTTFGTVNAAGNVSTGTIAGITTTVYTPITPPTGLTAAQTLTVGSATLNYVPPTTQLSPTGDQGRLGNADIALVNNFYGQFITYTGTSGSFGQSASKNNINGSNFQNYFTPPPAVIPVGSGNLFVTTAYPFVGSLMNNLTVGQLSVIKFMPPVVQQLEGKPASVNYTVGTVAVGNTDGAAWFTAAATPSTVLASSTTFAPSTTYLLWVTLKDNGSFDLDGVQDGLVTDPPSVGLAGSTSGGGGSSDGCVFNPLAGLSVEWALLILPALAALVARIRRK